MEEKDNPGMENENNIKNTSESKGDEKAMNPNGLVSSPEQNPEPMKEQRS